MRDWWRRQDAETKRRYLDKRRDYIEVIRERDRQRPHNQKPVPRDAAKAHWTVSNAIRDGRLHRQPCEKCGSERSDAHHADYSKPLEVQWLCRKHHGEQHRIYEAKGDF